MIASSATVGVKTNVITGTIITKEYGGDSPQFEPLVKYAHDNVFSIRDITVDKAQSGRKNLEVVDELGEEAYIPLQIKCEGESKGL
ncbi:MAG: hypothetical protein ACOC80_12280 [Petrotogales bacterium]